MNSNSLDPQIAEAVKIVCQYDKVGPSLLQRKLSIGYARAARLLDMLEDAGIVGSADEKEPSKPRKVLVKSGQK